MDVEFYQIIFWYLLTIIFFLDLFVHVGNKVDFSVLNHSVVSDSLWPSWTVDHPNNGEVCHFLTALKKPCFLRHIQLGYDAIFFRLCWIGSANICPRLPGSPTLQVDALPSELPKKPHFTYAPEWESPTIFLSCFVHIRFLVARLYRLHKMSWKIFPFTLLWNSSHKIESIRSF